MNKEEILYKNYCDKIYDVGLDEIDYASETFISEVIDLHILLELMGWIKNGEALTFDEFVERLNSKEPEIVNKDGLFEFQKLTFSETWTTI